jgi:sulfatase modifying factor 1
MARIPGGEFVMGCADFYPEEQPVRRASVDGFWMDEHPVTVAEFRRFVKATGHVTWAEIPPDPAHYPDALPELLVAGSLVFTGSSGPVDLSDHRNWWSWVPGADWRHPEGPGSTVHGRELHPVTHVAHADALAYAEWAGKQLPTETEWERAARGGLEGAVFCWGDEFAPRGRLMANTWQGAFPWQNLSSPRFQGTTPVGHFPANGFDLYDMAGNVWEWTTDEFRPGLTGGSHSPCCGPHGRGGPTDPPRRVIKGGSHLCAPNYCLRYRPAARQGEPIDTTSSHIGFRCILREAA